MVWWMVHAAMVQGRGPSSPESGKAAVALSVYAATRHPHSWFCFDSLVRNLRRALPFTTAKVAEASFIVRLPCRNSLWMTLCMFSSETASRTHLKARGIFLESGHRPPSAPSRRLPNAMDQQAPRSVHFPRASTTQWPVPRLDGASAACSLCLWLGKWCLVLAVNSRAG